MIETFKKSRKCEKYPSQRQAHQASLVSIAIVGYPNAGKSTLFSALSGSMAHSANYPGTTVDISEARFSIGERNFIIYDLPGMVSTLPQSEDERVCRDFLFQSNPDIVLQILNAGSLSKDLYLTLELMEYGYSPLLVINKADISEATGIMINKELLEKRFGLPVFVVNAVNHETLLELKNHLAEYDLTRFRRSPTPRLFVNYGILSDYMNEAEEIIRRSGVDGGFARLKAIELLRTIAEDGEKNVVRGKVKREIKEMANAARLETLIEMVWRRCKREMNAPPVALVAEARHALIRGILSGVVKTQEGGQVGAKESEKPLEMGTGEEISEPERIAKTTASTKFLSFQESLDRIALHPVLGIALFFLVMWVTFQVTFAVGFPLSDLVSQGFNFVGEMIKGWIVGMPMLASLLADGIFGGVGAVLSFAPLILVLFFAISLLEDSGYLARGVILMDGALRRFGLSGRSFVPMFLAFGCNVPGVLAARTIPNTRERIFTILALPFMSCSARLPVYLLLIAGFFDRRIAGTILFLIYLLGIISALLLSSILKTSVRRGRDTLVALELPNYQVPRLRGSLLSSWRQARHYFMKAGTIIFAISVLMWALFAFPTQKDFSLNGRAVAVEVDGFDNGLTESGSADSPFSGRNLSEESKISKSYGGRLGKALEPIFAPLGFDYRIVMALISAGFAKEIFISTLATIYSTESENNEKLLRELSRNSGLTALSALALIVFILLYMPCLPTAVTMYKELKSPIWFGVGVVSYFLIAYGFALSVILVGGLLGLK